MIEQMVASVISKICKISNINTWYFEEIPENFKYPSLYFPIEVVTKNDTLDTYIVCYMIFMKIFDLSTSKANETAFKIIHELNKYKNKISILNVDGTETGHFIRIYDEKMKKLDKGIIQIQLTWDSSFFYVQYEAQKIQEFIVELLKK